MENTWRSRWPRQRNRRAWGMGFSCTTSPGLRRRSRPMIFPRPFFPPTLPPRPIAQYMICQSCGYNLRGMTEETWCPECGVMVASSLAGGRPRYADSDWVLHMRRALVRLLIAIAISAVACYVSWQAIEFRSGVGGGALLTIFVWGAHVFVASALWGLARDEPRRDRLGFAGPLLRVCAVALVILPVLMIASASLFELADASEGDDAINITTMLMSPLVAWLLFERLCQIAQRFHWPELRTWARISGWALALVSLGASLLGPDILGSGGATKSSAGMSPLISDLGVVIIVVLALASVPGVITVLKMR